MAHVTALAQHILTLEPDKDAARLCFYNYLKNLCEPGQAVNSDLLNRFFCRALVFTHWQENKASLFAEVLALVHHFSEATRAHVASVVLDGVMEADRIQVVAAESLLVMEEAVSRHLDKVKAPTDRFRVFRDSNERVITVMLLADHSLQVTAYPKYLLIKDGNLSPLCADFSLAYTADLQLSTKGHHQLDIGPHASARFNLGADGIHGTLVRGYTFQKFSTMEGGGTHRYPVLFYPLKRVEQFFINRKTDPMYIELTGLLEKATDLVSAQHPDAQKFANTALERGRLALEHIYPDDKVVTLLIKNLEKTLALESARLAQAQAAAARAAAPAPVYDTPAEADGIDLVEAMALQKGRFKKTTSPAPAEKAAEKVSESWQKIRPLDI